MQEQVIAREIRLLHLEQELNKPVRIVDFHRKAIHVGI